jgi:uncharacterized membrane protein
MPFLDIATILSAGLLIGNEFAVSGFINPVIEKLDDTAQASAIRLFAARLGAAMPFWYALCLILLLIETILRRHQPGYTLLVTASAIWIAVILLTILFLVPINNRMARLAQGPLAEQSRQEHNRWETLHRIRILALTVSLICFLLAIRC